MKTKKFKKLFRPLTPEEYEERIINYIKEICYQNPDGTWSADGDVSLFKVGLTKLPVRFKVVKGGFDCSHNKLTSLEGSPKRVGGYFDCSHNELTSLEGGPEMVRENFSCYGNKLTTLW